MKKPCTHIKAKSSEQGDITLVDHTEHVLTAIDKIAEYLKVDKQERQISRYGAILHDIGKANPIFQKRLVEKRDITEAPYRHELASLCFLPLFPKKMHTSLIDMVVAHHRSIKKDGREQGILDLEERFEEEQRGGKLFEIHARKLDEWQEGALKILEWFEIKTRKIGHGEVFDAFYDAVEHCRKKPRGWSKWKGIMIAADHFASSLNDSVYEAIAKAFRTPNLSFYHNEDRKSTLYPLSHIPVNNPKPHTLVTAPTGAGKTDFLLRRCKGRVFYTLPFQASINAMYERIKEEINDPVSDIRLLHASSRLIIRKGNYEERALQDKAGASLKILTPYQLASIAFGTRGYESIMIDVQECDVILDEIHTYTNLSRAIVLKVIEVLKYLGCRIHIGTATMPTSLKKEVLQLLGKENTYEVQLTPEQLDKFNRHTIHKITDFKAAIPALKKALDNKEKVLLVCNRVARSQELYSQLDEIVGEVPKMLIHSRYKRKDRAELEDRLKRDFNEFNGPCIVVSTQVVEVSLDINFDLMITEAAPIDSLIQRFGRINRKRTKENIGKTKPVYVLAPPEGKKDALPYDLEAIQKSYEVLSDGQVLQERKIQHLIDQVYDDISTKQIDLLAIFKEGQFLLKELRHRQKSVLIDQMEIETVSAVQYEDWEKKYKTASADERHQLEIPVSYKSIGFRNLEQEKKIGSRPFIIPDKAYDPELGMILSEAVPENYTTFEMI